MAINDLKKHEIRINPIPGHVCHLFLLSLDYLIVFLVRIIGSISGFFQLSFQSFHAFAVGRVSMFKHFTHSAAIKEERKSINQSIDRSEELEQKNAYRSLSSPVADTNSNLVCAILVFSSDFSRSSSNCCTLRDKEANSFSAFVLVKSQDGVIGRFGLIELISEANKDTYIVEDFLLAFQVFIDFGQFLLRVGQVLLDLGQSFFQGQQFLFGLLVGGRD